MLFPLHGVEWASSKTLPKVVARLEADKSQLEDSLEVESMHPSPSHTCSICLCLSIAVPIVCFPSQRRVIGYQQGAVQKLRLS